MNDRNLLRGLFLAVVALAFGAGALRYPVGTLAHAGPGLFPLMVSALLLVVAVFTIVRSRFVPRVPMDLRIKSIGLLMLALCGFTFVSLHLKMLAGIVFMVFVASLAASSFSWQRNLKIAAGLVVVAFGFQRLLGLNLPLL
ncbi:MAG: tripartite tricarboxylate transporter TctB family protein [Burkholderiales bacterium]|nr:MAG: tripartite tricarboxylate transporter TctB family protein [Burkholderiales bacterium]